MWSWSVEEISLARIQLLLLQPYSRTRYEIVEMRDAGVAGCRAVSDSVLESPRIEHELHRRRAVRVIRSLHTAGRAPQHFFHVTFSTKIIA